MSKHESITSKSPFERLTGVSDDEVKLPPQPPDRRGERDDQSDQSQR